MLRYAGRDVFSFVMLFSQQRMPDDEERMKAMTREVVDASLALGETYDPPYRLHAAREEFVKAHPEAPRFFERKRKYDPTGLFQNQFSMPYNSQSPLTPVP